MFYIEHVCRSKHPFWKSWIRHCSPVHHRLPIPWAIPSPSPPHSPPPPPPLKTTLTPRTRASPCALRARPSPTGLGLRGRARPVARAQAPRCRSERSSRWPEGSTPWRGPRRSVASLRSSRRWMPAVGWWSAATAARWSC